MLKSSGRLNNVFNPAFNSSEGTKSCTYSASSTNSLLCFRLPLCSLYSGQRAEQEWWTLHQGDTTRPGLCSAHWVLLFIQGSSSLQKTPVKIQSTRWSCPQLTLRPLRFVFAQDKRNAFFAILLASFSQSLSQTRVFLFSQPPQKFVSCSKEKINQATLTIFWVCFPFAFRRYNAAKFALALLFWRQ